VVRAKVLREGKRFSFAQPVATEQESPDRTKARCQHFGTCGGCVFQNLRYDRQLEIKQNHLLQTLRRIGGVDVRQIDVRQVVPSVDQYYYRSKVDLVFARAKGHTLLGFRERVSPFERYQGRVVPVHECPIFSRALGAMLPAVVEYVEQVCTGGRKGKTRLGEPQGLTLREAKWNGRLMICINTHRRLDQADLLVHRVRAAVPEVASICAVSNGTARTLYGTACLEERLGPHTFRVYPETFFQPNSRTAEKLYESIPTLCGLTGQERVLGLYCGAGPIEIFLSPFAREVVGIDSEADNISAAMENCEINNIRNCTFQVGTAERIETARLRGPFDVVVVDPPRAGLAPGVPQFIAAAKIPRCLYVSCNPSTLARDLKRLREYGYEPVQVGCLDFFPHAAHVEAVVLLEKP
jgi:23S rRNA (uracil1939-C5)-methyltransferase